MPLLPLLAAAKQARDLLQVARKALEHHRLLPEDERERLRVDADQVRALAAELTAAGAESLRSHSGRPSKPGAAGRRDATLIAAELRDALARLTDSMAQEVAEVAKTESRTVRYTAKAVGFGARRLDRSGATTGAAQPSALGLRSMWGSKKPKPPPVALSPRVEPVVAAEPPAVQDQLRGANARDGLINRMVDQLPEDERVIALCCGGPGEFGVAGPRYGVYVLTDRQLIWRNEVGQSFHVALDDVQRIDTTMISQHCVYIEVVTHGGHETSLALSDANNSRGRHLHETLETLHRSPRSLPQVEPASSQLSVADELEKLASLRQRGILSAAEFESQKRTLLDR